MLTVKNAKTVTIPDPTQADLNLRIAAGQYPAATTLNDIALGSDWNANLLVSGQLAIANIENVGTANGLATLDSGGKVPSGQLPSYVDDVLEFANLAAFPVTGSSGIIYVADDTGKIYRWSGSAYIEISSNSVNSVFGRTGVVTAQSGDYNSGQVTESGNLYYTDTRARAAVSVTTTGTSGPASYNNTTGVLNVPQYQAAGSYATGTGTANGTNTGDQTITLTSDVTGSGTGSFATTLATVNSNTGPFGSASSVAAFTVNAKGLTTAASAVPIQIAESQVTNLVSDLAAKQATGNYITALTGDVTASGPGSAAATLSSVNSNVGSFTNANITVDAKGRISAASNGTAGGVTYNVNTRKIDQTPAGTGYGTLAGTVNGSNTVFTVSNGSYVSGSLEVILNGQVQAIGSDFTETLPGSGTFTFAIAPASGGLIQAIYITQANTNYTTTPTGTVWTATAYKQVTNTATQTSAVPTSGVGTLTIPANFPIVGRSYRLELYGTYQTPALPGSVTVRIKIGSVTVASVAVAASILATSSTVNELYGEAIFTYRTIGATGTVTCNGFLVFEIASGVVELGFSTAMMNGNNPLNDTVVIDTTTAGLIDVTEQWSNAQAGQGTVISQGMLEVLN